MAKRKTIWDKVNQLNNAGFVGREVQLQSFRENIHRDPEDLHFTNIFNIYGNGGVGKTTLLRQFEEIARKNATLVAYSDEYVKDVPAFMNAVAEALEKDDCPLRKFKTRYKIYRQKKEELETDPKAPQGFAAFVGRTIAKGSISLSKTVPGIGTALEFVDTDSFTNQAGEWASFVAKKLSNKDEVQLILEPEKVLTPIWLEDLSAYLEDRKLALLIDTYEVTHKFLDLWLRDLLMDKFGDFPFTTILVISGRHKLNPNDWNVFNSLCTVLPMEPFTEKEATDFLNRRGIAEENLVKAILKFSGCLPVLLATLAEASPDSTDDLGDVSSTAVERFLKWVDDPLKKDTALYAAVPREINLDIISLLISEEKARELFTWLQSMPFIKKHERAWTYHQVVRTQMLRYLKTLSPKLWSEKHKLIASYFENQQTDLKLEKGKEIQNETWRALELSVLYHRLCQNFEAYLSQAINSFLGALKEKRNFAEAWAQTIFQAEEDNDIEENRSWGKILIKGLESFDQENNDYQPAIDMFSSILNFRGLREDFQAIAFAWRGDTYRLMKESDKANQDFDKAIELDPKYKWALAGRAETYQQKEEYDKAIQDLDKAIEIDPEYKWAIHQKGIIFRLMKDYEKALQSFDEVLKTDPKYKWAYAQKSLVWEEKGEYDKAIEYLNKAIETDPDYDWAYGQRGFIYQKKRKYDQAIEDFSKGIALNPEYKWAYAQRGITYQFKEDYDEAINDLTKAVEIDPNYHGAIGQRGFVYQLKQEYEQAIQDFDKGIEINPDYVWAYVQRGYTMQLKQEYEQAIQDYSKAVEIDPEYKWGYAHRGLLYQHQKKYDNAIEDYNRAIEIDSENHSFVGQRGLIYQNKENYDLAIQDYDKAIQMNPDYDWAMVQKGITYRLMEKYREALINFDKAIEINSNSDWNFAQRGIINRMIENYPQAITDFTRAIELKSNNDWNFVQRGITYRLMEKFNEALKDMQSAFELSPANDWNFMQRGITFREMKQYDEVFKDFDKAIELDPKSAWNFAQRGDTFVLINKYKKALLDFDKAIELDPEYRFAFSQRGVAYRAMKEYRKAIEDFKLAIQLESNDDWSHYNLYITYQLINKSDEAENYLNKALQFAREKLDSNPLDFRIHYNVILYLLLEEGFEAAKAEGEKILRNGANIYRTRGFEGDLEELLEFFPNHKDAQRMLEWAQDALSKFE